MTSDELHWPFTQNFIPESERKPYIALVTSETMKQMYELQSAELLKLEHENAELRELIKKLQK